MSSQERVRGPKKRIDGGKKKESLLLIFLKLIAFIGVVGFILFVLTQIEGFIEGMQVKAFAHSDSLLFVLKAGTLTRFAILFFSLLAIVFLVLAFRSANSRSTKAIFGSSIFAVLAGVFLYFFLSFDYYYDVTKETIYYKKGITAKEKSYPIGDVSGVQVSYEYQPSVKGRGVVLVDYEVTMKDGERFNAYNATHFADHIVDFDKLLAGKGVPITRNPPGDAYLSILCDFEEGQRCPDWIDYIYGLR